MLLLKDASIQRLAIFRIDKRIIVEMVESLSAKVLPDQANICLFLLGRYVHVSRELIHIVAHSFQLVHRRQGEVFWACQVHWMTVISVVSALHTN